MAGNAGALRAGKAVIEFTLSDKGVDSALRAIERRAAKTGDAMKSIGTTMAAAGGVITGAIGACVKSFVATGDALNDMSTRTGASVESLSKLSYAASQSGTSIETVEKAFRGMQKFALAAGRGSQGVIDTLGELGLSVDALAGKTPEQMFSVLADAISKVQDPSTRAALAMKVFGKSGSDLLPMLAGGAAGLAAMGAEAQRLGQVMSGADASAAAKLDDSINKLWTGVKGAANAIGAAVAGPLTAFVDSAGEATVSAIGWARANSRLVQVVAAVGAGLTATGAGVYAVGTAFTVAASAAGGLNVALAFIAANPVITAAAAIAALVGGLVLQFRAAHDEVTLFDKALRGLDGKQTFGDPGEIQQLIARYDQLAAKTKLTATEQDEARKIVSKLRDEFGNLASTATGDRLTNVAQFKAQLQAAQGGPSNAIQQQRITQAEQARFARDAEGAGGDELKRRDEEIAAMRAQLAQSQRIVADAAPFAMPTMPDMGAVLQSAAASVAATPAAIGNPGGTSSSIGGGDVEKLLTEIRDNGSKLLKQIPWPIFS